MQRLLIIAVTMGPLFVSRLYAQCTGSDASSYWDYSFDSSSYPSVVDYWNVTDGSGCNDGCSGTIQYVARAFIEDSSGTYIYDGGTQSQTVAETAPGLARSDASGSPPDAINMTYTGTGYAYLCGCSSCYKLADFTFTSVFSLHTTYYSGPTLIGNDACTYGALACTSGTPLCDSRNYFGFQFSSTCPSIIKVGYLVTGNTCLVGVAFNATGQTVRVCT
jgi:hypothetical protein